MSRENVDRVRSAFEYYRREGGLDPAVFDRDVEWWTRSDLPDTGVHRGYEGVAELNSSWTESFDDYRIEPKELIDAGDRVVIPVVLRGRVRSSDTLVEQYEVWVMTFRGGKVVEVREYRTMTEAQEAVGGNDGVSAA
jgi:uncharacterized protein